MTIQDLIFKAGFSFDELRNATGIPVSTLSDILSGKAELSHCQARTVRRLAAGLGLSTDELLEIDESIRKENAEKAAQQHIAIDPKLLEMLGTDLFDLMRHIQTN